MGLGLTQRLNYSWRVNEVYFRSGKNVFGVLVLCPEYGIIGELGKVIVSAGRVYEVMTRNVKEN